MKEQIKKLLDTGEKEEAIAVLEEYLKTTEDEAMLLLLGELYYNQGRTIDALNKFNSVVQINPENRTAANYITMINNILNYYNKDLWNP